MQNNGTVQLPNQVKVTIFIVARCMLL